MTFFLDQASEPPEIKARQYDVEPAAWGGFGAAFGKTALETNANFRQQREEIAVRDDLARDIIEQLGMDAVRPVVDQVNERARDQGFDSKVRELPENLEEAVEQFGPMFSQRIIEMSREAAEADPDTWSDYDLTEEGIAQSVQDRLQAEHRNHALSLALMGDRGVVAQALGSMAGATADVRNAPFLLMGGGSGSLARIMGREALLNASAELVTMPSQYKMAELLDIPDPNVAARLAEAAVGGAILGGGFELLARGLGYFRSRGKTPEFDGVDEIQSRILVDKAEDILTASSDPIKDIATMLRRSGPEPRTIESDVAFSTGGLARTSDVTFTQPDLRPRVDFEPALVSNERFQTALDISPDVMREYRSLTLKQQEFRAELDQVDAEAGNVGHVIQAAIEDAEARLSTVQGKGPKAKLRQDIREMKADLQEVRALRDSPKSPEKTEVREAIQKTDEQLRDLAPKVTEAFKAADEKLGAPATNTGKPSPARTETASTAMQRFSDEVTRPQVDRFSEVSSPEARAIHDSVEADIRTDIEEGKSFNVDLDDGRGARPVEEVLDEMKATEEFAEIIQLCGRPS